MILTNIANAIDNIEYSIYNLSRKQRLQTKQITARADFPSAQVTYGYFVTPNSLYHTSLLCQQIVYKILGKEALL